MATEISKISDWIDKDGDSIQEKEFFLRENFNDMYDRVRMENASAGQDFEPIEQLSPKGLALLSAIYAEKDGSELQPLIASTTESFQHILQLVADASTGTRVTVILQFTDAYSGPNGPLSKYGRNPFYGESYQDMLVRFGNTHKTVCKLEKEVSGVSLLTMDSTTNPLYSVLVVELARKTLKEGELLHAYTQENIKNWVLFLIFQDRRIPINVVYLQ